MSNLKILIIFSLGIIIGVFWHYYRFFPIPLISEFRHRNFEKINYESKDTKLKKKWNLKIYYSGSPLYIDRDYTDSFINKDFDRLALIQLERHRREFLVIRLLKDSTVYRFLCKENDNRHFKDWEEVDSNILIQGDKSNLDLVVKKKFTTGLIALTPGGPLSASPILINMDCLPEQMEDYIKIEPLKVKYKEIK